MGEWWWWGGGCTFVKQGRVGRAKIKLKSYSYIYFFVSTKCAFFARLRLHAQLCRLRVFSRASCCVALRSPARTLQRTLGLRPGSVACALGVKNPTSWLFFTGLHSAPPSLAGQWKPHTLFCSAAAAAAASCLLSHRPSNPLKP